MAALASQAAAPPDAARAAVVVAIDELAHGYRGRVVVEIASWTVAPGQHSLILGASGSGESTLLHLIAGLPHPGRGRLPVADRTWGRWPRLLSTRFVAARPASCCNGCI